VRGFFVTGTDTGVGKTVVSAALALRTGFRYWKPIQTGPDDDTAEVIRLAGCEGLNDGIRLPDAVSPHLAARRAGVRIDLAKLFPLSDDRSALPADGWIVEGAGGALVPVNERDTMADLMVMLGMPVVVVARTTLGTINHTLLTLEALRARRLSIDRVVMVGGSNPENRDAVAQYGCVVVQEMPWFDPLSPEALRGWCK
jgi:dethiobiotin synthase